MRVVDQINDRLRTLTRVAHADWISARILWNLGFLRQSVWLLQQSIEKYLKTLWAKYQIDTFTSTTDLDYQLRKLSRNKNEPHDLIGVFKKLPASVQTKLGKHQVILVNSMALRYATTSGMGYGDKPFRSGEKLIKDIRILLGENPKKNILEEWKDISFDVLQSKGTRMEQIRRAVLSLKNPTTTKKDKRRKKVIYRRMAIQLLGL